MADTERDDDDQPDYRRGPDWHRQQATARREWDQLRELSIEVPCPRPPIGCGMPIGAACVNRDGGQKPTLLKKFPAHPRRIANARRARKVVQR